MNLLSRLPESDVVAAQVERERAVLRGIEALRRLPRRELNDLVLRDCGVDVSQLDTDEALRRAAELGTTSVRCTDTRATVDITARLNPITAVEESPYSRSHGGWRGDERARARRPAEPDDFDFQSQYVGARPCPRALRDW